MQTAIVNCPIEPGPMSDDTLIAYQRVKVQNTTAMPVLTRTCLSMLGVLLAPPTSSKTSRVSIALSFIVTTFSTTSYVGSHVADQVLHYGFNVRGSVRNIEKHRWMEEFFAKKHSPGRFALFEIPDITKEGASAEAVKDAAGVIHLAPIVAFDPDPDVVISTAVNSSLSILKASGAQPSVSRFVLTPPATTAAQPHPNDTSIITSESYNEEAVEKTQHLAVNMSDIERESWVIIPTPSERVFGYTHPYNWYVVLDEFRALFPDKTLIDNVDGIWDDLAVIEGKDRAEALLRQMGQAQFTTLREGLQRLVE